MYMSVYTNENGKTHSHTYTCRLFLYVCVCYKFRVTERAHIIGLMFSDRPSGSARES